MNAEKAMTIVGPIIEKLIGLVTMILPLAILAVVGFYGYNYAK
jgi:predicted membrane-bound mannosyltransferase